MEKKSILVIEDKDVVGTLIRDVLISTGRYEVVRASNGYEGLLKVIGEDSPELPSDLEELEETIKLLAYNGLPPRPLAKKFHLVLSDIRMPGIDGIETLRLIRKLCPDQVCMLITGYGLENRERDIEAVEPKAILRKPVTNDELVSAIDGACGIATSPS
jgi:CheY-like chemotaxis protein